ncbi:MAG: RHS repeat-associated core domain-containing protein, partial [Thiohalocapsa sp.]
FDPRQRLTQVAGESTTVTYSFDARAYLASATSDAGDTLELYHGPGRLPRAANAFRTSGSTTQMSSWAGPLRQVDELDSGTLTASSGGYLLQPRKDVAGVYDPTASTLTAYQYDPYGAETDDTDADYDLTSNFWRYAGEFRDPTWGGYYLRARWYLPEFQTFTSRDPASTLNRYGYAGGNPIGRVDPSGHSFASFAKDIDHFLADLDIGDSGAKGVLGALSSIFLAPIVGPAQILADPQQYWKGKDFWLNDIALVAGVVAEGLGQTYLANETSIIPWRHALVDTGVGLGVTTLSSVRVSSSGKWSLSAKSALEGLENTLGGILWNRELMGVGYDRFDTGVADAFWDAEANLQPGQMALYRFREGLGASRREIPTFWDKRGGLTSPVLDGLNLGLYHEGVLAIMRKDENAFSWFTSENQHVLNRVSGKYDAGTIPAEIARRTLRLDRVGTLDYDRGVATKLLSNPLELRLGTGNRDLQAFAGINSGAKSYHLLLRNCHVHASAMAALFK